MNMADFKMSIEGAMQERQKFLHEIPDPDEDNTRDKLLNPILRILGYNFDTLEVKTQWAAGVRNEHDHKVDYALFSNTESSCPIAIIECKRFGENLNKKNIQLQLREYFQGINCGDTHIAILTDGDKFLFFTDNENPNLMDINPYWEFKLSTISNEDLKELATYSKNTINSTSFNLNDRIEKLKKSRFAKELKESLDRGPIPSWLIKATEHEWKSQLHYKLTSSTKAKLESEIEDMWEEICKSLEVNREHKEGIANNKQLFLKSPVKTDNTITLPSLIKLIKGGQVGNLSIKSYKLGNDPEVSVKSTADFMADCISDLEKKNKLLSKFGNELQFASKEKPKRSNHFIKGWFIDTNTSTKVKMLQIKKALEKVGRNPEELQLKVCAA